MRLEIEKAIYGGAGLARAKVGEVAGKTVFVPFTLPGEQVEAHITDERRSFAHAELDAVLEPAAGRTTPACPYFGACGGCQYQHATYGQQLEMKAAILRETLERAHVGEVPPIATVHGEPWCYRNRIRLLVQAHPFALCYRERRSNTPLPVERCLIAASVLERALRATERVGAGLGELCNEVEFFTNEKEDTLLVSLTQARSGPSASAKLGAFATALAREVPELRGVGLFTAGIGKQPTRLAAHWGESSLVYKAAGFDYRVSLGSFFQVNLRMVDAFVELATADQAGELAWDLYAGVGLFSRALAANFKRVVAVEAASSSAADLRHNLGGKPHTAVAAGTLEFLRQKERERFVTVPDLILVDPPRTGLGHEVTSLLSKVGARRIVYVSCDPATLSRDVHALIQSGYHLQKISLVDLFPQTFHMESVAVLERG